MWLDVTQYYEFYQSSLGHATQRLITRKIHQLWPNTHGKVVGGYGYPNPYLNIFYEEAERTISLMPAPQGVMPWPSSEKNCAILTEEATFPLSDQSIDRLLVIHGIEHTESTHDLLREFWRILSPGGRLLLVAPNRRGFWTRTVSTPFGHGQSYTGNQLFGLVEASLFTPLKAYYCLYLPPSQSFLTFQFYESSESVGEHLFKKLGGVVLVEAEKRVLSPTKKEAKAWNKSLVFVPKPLVR
jgi:SAM-dependent methyltransferase